MRRACCRQALVSKSLSATRVSYFFVSETRARYSSGRVGARFDHLFLTTVFSCVWLVTCACTLGLLDSGAPGDFFFWATIALEFGAGFFFAEEWAPYAHGR